jgi:hypothetical protein
MRYQVAQEIETGRKRLRKILYPFPAAAKISILEENIIYVVYDRGRRTTGN